MHLGYPRHEQGRDAQWLIGPTERRKLQANEQLVAPIMRSPYDGLNRFALNINRLPSGVCKSCARTRLAVLPSNTSECDVSIRHARYWLARDAGHNLRDVVAPLRGLLRRIDRQAFELLDFPRRRSY